MYPLKQWTNVPFRIISQFRQGDSISDFGKNVDNPPLVVSLEVEKGNGTVFYTKNIISQEEVSNAFSDSAQLYEKQRLGGQLWYLHYLGQEGRYPKYAFRSAIDPNWYLAHTESMVTEAPVTYTDYLYKNGQFNATAGWVLVPVDNIPTNEPPRYFINHLPLGNGINAAPRDTIKFESGQEIWYYNAGQADIQQWYIEPARTRMDVAYNVAKVTFTHEHDPDSPTKPGEEVLRVYDSPYSSQKLAELKNDNSQATLTVPAGRAFYIEIDTYNQATWVEEESPGEGSFQLNLQGATTLQFYYGDPRRGVKVLMTCTGRTTNR